MRHSNIPIREESRIIHWRKNLWRTECCSNWFEFTLFEFSKGVVNSSGKEYMHYTLTIFNFLFIWRVKLGEI